MLHGKHPAFSKAKLGVKEKSGVVKKSSKAAAGTASKVAGKAAEAVQTVATASQGVMQGAATAAQGAATAAKTAATQAVKSAQKVCTTIKPCCYLTNLLKPRFVVGLLLRLLAQSIHIFHDTVLSVWYSYMYVCCPITRASVAVLLSLVHCFLHSALFFLTAVQSDLCLFIHAYIHQCCMLYVT